MIQLAGHDLVSACARKINDHDLALRVIALQIGGIEQKRHIEDSLFAHCGQANVGAS